MKPLQIRIARRRPARVLYFDIETRLQGFHKGGRFRPDGCEPIAIAWSWEDSPTVYVEVIRTTPLKMLKSFVGAYDRAHLVCGHYVRKFDLPILNAAMLENNLPLLKPKHVCDTHADKRAMAGMSFSQENLAGALKIEDKKLHLSDTEWRDITRGNISLAVSRVKDDVRQLKSMRAELLRRNALRPPRLWKP